MLKIQFGTEHLFSDSNDIDSPNEILHFYRFLENGLKKESLLNSKRTFCELKEQICREKYFTNTQCSGPFSFFNC